MFVVGRDKSYLRSLDAAEDTRMVCVAHQDVLGRAL